ncbi:MAG: hypothetical protein JKY53_03375, partial [Flavobacteriales bacterium]|nr:hypothetical protein [Flavobacteriales bacterium]
STQHLIIDIRNNRGGFDNIGAELFSYLIDSTWHFYDYLEANIWKADNPFFEYSNLPQPEIDTLMTQLILEENRQIVSQDGFELLDSTGISNNYPSYSGKCYLLLNEHCFSGATEFATTFKVYGRGLIIGQETGGGFGVNCSGWIPTFTLPNSGIRLNVPLFKYVSQTYGESYEGGVLPDIKIEECIENLFKQEDVILNTALEQIKLEGSKNLHH